MLRDNRADAVVLTGGTLLDNYYKEKMNQYLTELKEQGSLVIGDGDTRSCREFFRIARLFLLHFVPPFWLVALKSLLGRAHLYHHL